jgi:predicted DCC family thiol-disulfide oxidoreductase YuxK
MDVSTSPAPVRPERGPDRAASKGVTTLPPRIVLYDGVCGLCSRTVRWLMRRDGGSLWYAPLQGETAAQLRALHPRIPVKLDSVVLVEDGRVHLRSKVFLHAARHLRRPWRWAYAFRWMPGFLLDPMYWVVAKLRYRIFGKFDACTLPTTDERAQLLP